MPSVLANPSGGTVVGGSATISSGPGQVTVNQTSNRAVVNWQGFSIDQGQTTMFVQPSSKSAILNRVTGGSVSRMEGNLNANGQVYLVNRNGVVVGKTGRINTAGFTASTHDVADAQFMNGGDLNFSGNSNAKVQNFGKIKATDGDVTLIAREVENHGRISAKKGSVNLAGGTEVLLKPSGADGQRVYIKSNSGSGSVVNTGHIRAAAAELRAAGGNEYALAVNNSGVIRATGVDRSGGRIVLKAQRGDAVTAGRVQNSGRLIAKAKAPGKSGGSVVVTGTDVQLTSTSRIDVSSTGIGGKGGTVNIGGGYQGKDAAIANARTVAVEAGSEINADGQRDAGPGNGDPGVGGKVVIWSEDETTFLGNITARGAGRDVKGSGGFVEVSSHGFLNFNGTVDTAGGMLLLDPGTLTVSNNPDSQISPGSLFQPNPSTADSILNIATLLSLLNSTDVTLLAQNRITIDTAIAPTLGSASLILQTTAPGSSIVVNADIVLQPNGNLIFQTPTLFLNADLTVSGTGTLQGNPGLTTVNVGISGGTQGRIQDAVDLVNSGLSSMINVAPGTYKENVRILDKSLTIKGSSGTIVDGDKLDCVFLTNAPGQTIRLDNLVITNGQGFSGGGIYIFGMETVYVTNSTIRDNNLVGGYYGGGILNRYLGTLFVIDSVISGNNAFIQGGGIFNHGTLTIINSTISGNSAAGFSATFGGGIFNYAGTTTVINSTISGNSAIQGGGIDLYTGTATIANCTISGNTATDGGGICIDKGIPGVLSARLFLDNSTLTLNTANSGGGILIIAGGTGTVRNTIIGGNIALSSNGRNVYGTFTDGGNNLVGQLDAFSAGFGVGPTATDSTMLNRSDLLADLGLAPLGDYGGPTKTHALLIGSPALGKGSNPLGLTTDQRGFSRTVGGQTDIGAYQVQTSYVVRNTGDYNAAQPRVENSLRAALSYAALQPADGAEKVSVIDFNIPTSDPGFSGGLWTIRVAVGTTGYAIDRGITINGATQPGFSGGIPVIVIDAGKLGSVFTTNANGQTIKFESLVITNGEEFEGGGIDMDGTETVHVTNSTIRGNSSVFGGGIDNELGTLFVTNSTISENLGGSFGGAIFNGSSTTIINSTISGNTSSNGGAIYASGATTITNSTISGNSAISGGAINITGAITITSSTITQNSATNFGGGVFISGSPLVTISNSIIAGNIAPNGTNVWGSITDGGNNLLGNTSGSNGFGTGPTPSTLLNKTDAEIGLAPLGWYGGPTQTHALLPGSLALNAGSNPLGLTTDQRGMARTAGGRTDIGAFEFQGYTYTVTGGTGQSAELMSAFGQPLVVTLTSPEFWLPAMAKSLGMTVTLTVPDTGAGATGTLTQTFDATGSASFLLTANRTLGTYNVGIANSGDADAFTLTNLPISLVISPTAGQGKTVGEADPAFLYTITGGSLLPGDFLSGALSRIYGEDPGFYAFLLGTLGNPNYKLSFTSFPAPAQFTIHSLPQLPLPSLSLSFADPNVPWYYIAPKTSPTHSAGISYAPPPTPTSPYPTGTLESTSSYELFQGDN